MAGVSSNGWYRPLNTCSYIYSDLHKFTVLLCSITFCFVSCHTLFEF